MTAHNKLVRDLIPEVLAAKKVDHTVRVLEDDQEYLQALRAKLLEEVHEYLETPTVEELADVREVVLALARFHRDLTQVQLQKKRRFGGFTRRLFLVETS